MKNSEIARVFQDMADLLELKEENIFKIRAYRRAAQVIEHLSNTDLFIKEIFRVLKAGGYTVIATSNLAAYYNILYLLIGKQPYVAMVSDEVLAGSWIPARQVGLPGDHGPAHHAAGGQCLLPARHPRCLRDRAGAVPGRAQEVYCSTEIVCVRAVTRHADFGAVHGTKGETAWPEKEC
jgi:hypothetical protein